MNYKNKSKKLNLIGYDNNCRVIDAGNCIIRIINQEYHKHAEEIYHIYKSNLEKIGIVDTKYDDKSKNLIHEKHIISYPYEWPPEMYKDAVLFHLNLFIELDKYELTIKDALPSNILYNFTQPVFVDFLSIVKIENLHKEEWLVEGSRFQDKRFAVVEKMLIPFMLIPLIAMSNKKYTQARTMLSEKACNMGNSQPELIEAYEENYIQFNGIIRSLKKYLKNLLVHRNKYNEINSFLNSYKNKNAPIFIDFIKDMHKFVISLDVTPPNSGYASFYDEKGEHFDYSNNHSWGNKQKNVYKVLKNEKPSSVIDVGANTGWFSFLAEKTGARVIALDIDNSCINSIYRLSKQNNNSILPLVISFDDLTKEYYGTSIDTIKYADRNYKDVPLFLSPIDRFQGDLVMCLGLLHHLILGMGLDIALVFKVLSKMTKKSILLEFVDINDPMIIGETSFFRNLYKYDKSNYNIDIIIKNGDKFFKKVEVLDSHPETRKLIYFKN